jgi:uncharacterized protein (TIGR02996 family)
MLEKNELEIFEREILADPFSDAPRLIYADWLDEQADPRAEFIRLQIGISEMHPRDPRLHLMESRCAELLSAHRDWWGGLKNMDADGRIQLDFSRGFPEIVSLSRPKSAFHLVNAAFKRSPFLNAICFLSSPITSTIRSCSERLRSLRFTDWTMLRISELATLPNLSELRLGYARVLNPSAVQEIAACKFVEQLRVLELGRAIAGDEALNLLGDADRFPKLERLILSGNQLPSDAFSRFVQCETAANLRELSITDNTLKGQTIADLFNSPAVNQLDFLELANVSGKKDQFSSFPVQVCPEKLKWFIAPRNRWEAGWLARLSLEEWPTALIGLDLSSNTVSNDDLASILQAKCCESLVSLDLMQCELEDRQGELLARSPAMRNLQRLNLSCNQLADKTAHAIAESDFIGNLLTLDLRHNRISNRGLTALLHANWSDRVLRIYLSHNRQNQFILRSFEEKFGPRVYIQNSIRANQPLPLPPRQ